MKSRRSRYEPGPATIRVELNGISIQILSASRRKSHECRATGEYIASTDGRVKSAEKSPDRNSSERYPPSRPPQAHRIIHAIRRSAWHATCG
jgi:hypothetical protein